MRSLLVLGWGLVLVATPAASQPAEVRRAFEQGNRQYAAGEYEAALRAYETALASGWTSGALHYNVAGAHYRLGHLGAAVQHYEKARRLLPERERLRHNLSVVRGQAQTPPPARHAVLDRARSGVREWVSSLVLFAAGAVLFLAALAWWVHASSGAEARFRPRGAVAALMAVALGLAALGLALSVPVDGGRAVALRGPLTVRSAPAPGADSTDALPEGTVLRLTGREGDWAKVRSSRGTSGWTRTDALGAI
jgi:tetratricopeptide (TPR) repeat protein